MQEQQERFDVIVVGGGLAGLAAAYRLAQGGLEVIVIERGHLCGAKNMTGGRLYGHSMEKLIPGFAAEAPVERRIVKEKIALLTDDGATEIGYTSAKLGESPSYTVVRARFDQWLAEKAEEAGAVVVTDIRVDDLLQKDGKVTGVNCGGEEIFADVVLLADGVNSLLAQKLGMKEELEPHQVAVGAKEVITLDEAVLNDRFGVQDSEGAAMLTVGYVTGGGIGGGFLYTNKDSISLGVVATVGDIGHADLSVPDMVDRFKEHPAIAPLIAGGKTAEYSAHLVPEGGYAMIPTLVGNGVLLAGDAAGLVINLGYTVRGMDFAVESGRLAAEAILTAKEKGDFSAKGLSVYKELLEDSFVMKELKRYRNFPSFMGASHRLYTDYPAVADDILAALFTVDGGGPTDILLKITKGVGRVGLINLAIDGMKGLGAL